MNYIPGLEQALQILEPVCIAILLVRIASQGLLRLYRAFTIYLAIWLFQDVAPVALGLNLAGNSYALFFFVSEPMAWIFSYLVLIELFDLTFLDFPGIRSAGRLLLYTAIATSAVVAALTAAPSLLHLHGADWLYTLYMVIERSVMIVSLILLGALQILMARSGLKLSRNTVRYGRVYAIHFATRALQVFLVGELDRKLVSFGNVGASLIDIACVAYLALTLTRSGVHAQVVTGPKLSEEQRQQLRGPDGDGERPAGRPYGETVIRIRRVYGALSAPPLNWEAPECGSAAPAGGGFRAVRRS